MILVKIARMGEKGKEFALQDNITINEALKIAGITVTCNEILLVNGGRTVNFHDILYNESTIIIQKQSQKPSKIHVKIGRVGRSIRAIELTAGSTVRLATSTASMPLLTTDNIWLAKEGSNLPHELISLDRVCQEGDIIILEQKDEGKRREIENILNDYINIDLNVSEYIEMVNKLVRLT